MSCLKQYNSMMNKISTPIFLLLATLFCSSTALFAFDRVKIFSPNDYIYPLEGLDTLYYSGNFGELRSDHFHSGVDIKTNGQVGKRVVAVADGYISRIAMTPFGYGLALYITHPNGSTSVYAHLERFNDKIAEYVEGERYRTRQHSLNLFCDPSAFPVKQGELIAYSGNSGSSAGPHLHFEIRSSATQAPINPVAQGIIRPLDNISPLIFTLHYIETDSLQGLEFGAPIKSYSVIKDAATYHLSTKSPLRVGRSGYFVLEASDRRNNSTNTFSLYRVAMSKDERPIFEYKINGFSFDKTRYCNAIGYYPIMIKSRNEAIRLSAAANSITSHYPTLVNRGIIGAAEGESHNIKIDLYDDCGNHSQLTFDIVGKSDDELFVADAPPGALVVDPFKDFYYRASDISISMPARTLYDAALFECEEHEASDSTMLTKVFEVMSYDIPLHKPMTIALKADVTLDLQKKAGIVCIGRSGNHSFLGGDYLSGAVTTTSRSTGKFYVAVDTEPPVLKLNIEEGVQITRSYFTCEISDSLSGVATYSATLNGEWIALTLDKGRLRHNFVSQPSAEPQELTIILTDRVGNTTTLTRNFIR